MIVESSDGTEHHDVGVVVDVVNEVIDIAASEVEPAPSFGAKIRTDLIAGMGKLGGKYGTSKRVTRFPLLPALSGEQAHRAIEQARRELILTQDRAEDWERGCPCWVFRGLSPVFHCPEMLAQFATCHARNYLETSICYRK